MNHKNIDVEKGFERVYSVNDYWDLPLLGTADFGGKPHLFKRLFDEENDDWGFVYQLAPIDQEFLHCFIRKEELGNKWYKAYVEGKVKKDTVPLPEDCQEYNQLEKRIEQCWDYDSKLFAEPVFKPIKAEIMDWVPEHSINYPRQVKWKKVKRSKNHW